MPGEREPATRRRRLARRERRTWAPVPPTPMPDGRIVLVPDRGEMFLRDTGGDGPTVLLLHGWMFASDLNWHRWYRPLSDAGFRVLATDHRGHGRGMRPDASFTLADCAADAADLVRTIGAGPVIAVGYSMGGPIAELMARDHSDVTAGLVACATPAAWDEPHMRRGWQAMGGLRLFLSLFPRQAWRWGLTRGGRPPDTQATSWLASELSRGSGRDIAEAGRELGRYDGRPWLGDLEQPSAVVVTTKDPLVPKHMQHELADVLGAPRFEVPCDHFGVSQKPDLFGAGFMPAVRSVADRVAAAGAPSAAAA